MQPLTLAVGLAPRKARRRALQCAQLGTHSELAILCVDRDNELSPAWAARRPGASNTGAPLTITEKGLSTMARRHIPRKLSAAEVRDAPLSILDTFMIDDAESAAAKPARA